jgi:hypothetical protein
MSSIPYLMQINALIYEKHYRRLTNRGSVKYDDVIITLRTMKYFLDRPKDNLNSKCAGESLFEKVVDGLWEEHGDLICHCVYEYYYQKRN